MFRTALKRSGQPSPLSGTRRRSKKNRRSRPHQRRLACELLEDRRLLSFAIGDYVRVFAPLYVRTWYGTDQPQISDPDYPGAAPAGTVGRVLDGPQSADGYTWYKLDYGAGAYTGWSSDHRLESSSARVAGTDVSKWQGVVDWSQVYQSGHQFAFAKATGGDDSANDDPRFTGNATGGRAAGVFVGAYHFAYPDLNPALTGPDSAESEANHFVSVAGPYITQGYLRPALDLERGSGLGKAALSAWVRKWLQTVQNQTGVEPVIYANSNYANNYLDSSLNTYDLWLAHWTYDLQQSPNDGVWNGWSFWQYSGDHYPPPSGTGAARIPGIAARALPDLFSGDRARLVSEFVIGGQAVPEITVSGNGVVIADGDATPSTADHTDFGVVIAGQAGPERTYTVWNEGDATLSLGTVSVPASYTLVEGLPGTLAAGASDTFTVRLNTAAAGTFAGDVSFTNGDSDESPFNFRITGTVYVPASADVIDVAPDPRTTAVDTITIVFNEPITGFDLSDLALTRDGGANLLTASQTLNSSDNVTWTLDKLSSLTGTAGSYVLTLTAAGSGITDLAGNPLAAGASDEWTTIAVSDLGPTDFLQIPGLAPSGNDLWYRCQAAHLGILTLEAIGVDSPDIAQLTLYDAQLSQLATSIPAHGNQRIDYSAAGAGETYYLKLSGWANDVDLRLTNLVNLNGGAVTVFGTEGDDQFEFKATSARQVTINGVQYDFPPAEAASVVFDGGAGANKAILSGTSGTETVTLRPGSVTLSGTDLYVAVLNAAEITANSEGGSDVARLYDSAGDDTFMADPTYGQLSGAGFSNRADGFRYVFAYATEGGNDTATLWDSAGNDTFDGRKDYAVLYATGFYNRASGFDTVTAHSTAGGIDIARLSDSTGDDTFTASPTEATMSGPGFSNRANKFRYVIGYASDGADTATLNGSAETDTFVATPTYAVLSATTYANRVSSFDTVIASGTPGGADTARLYDSAGDDTFIAYPTEATLSGPGFSNRVENFRYTHAYSTTGGTDTADLYDSGGSDTFVAYPSYGALYGTSFYNRANYFDCVVAHSSAGADLAKLYDSPGDDIFDAYLTYAVLFGAGFSNRADAFRYVSANSDAGGIDTANLHGSSGDETITGTYEYTRLQGGATDIMARALEQAFVRTGGGQDKATLYDSPGDDRLDAAADWATLSYLDRFVRLSELTLLARVTAISSRGGSDTKHVDAIDYVLETIGPWRPI